MRYREEYSPGFMLTLEIDHEGSSYGYYVTIEDNEGYGRIRKKFSIVNSDMARKLFDDTKAEMAKLRQSLLDLGWELPDDHSERIDWK